MFKGNNVQLQRLSTGATNEIIMPSEVALLPLDQPLNWLPASMSALSSANSTAVHLISDSDRYRFHELATWARKTLCEHSCEYHLLCSVVA